MKLRHITFTGIDESTDINQLRLIQEEFPYVEWGVLFSKKQSGNQPRYPNPKTFLPKLVNCQLNLSAHICGSLAREIVMYNNWEILRYITAFNFISYNRAQLNVANYAFVDMINTNLCCPEWLKEIIIQQRSPDKIDVYKAMRFNRNYVSILFDKSGGQGHLLDYNLCYNPYIKAGYAGGINPNNIATILQYYFEESYQPFWLDMESGVRNNQDQFDIDKVLLCLQRIDPIIKQYDKVYD